MKFKVIINDYDLLTTNYGNNVQDTPLFIKLDLYSGYTAQTRICTPYGNFIFESYDNMILTLAYALFSQITTKYRENFSKRSKLAVLEN